MRTVAAALASAIVFAAFTAPAAAATASEAFSDIKAGHWAEKAVTFVAVERGFMKGFPDRTFRGDIPFTRVQLALAIDELIRQLEAQTKVSWTTEGLGGYEFQDLPADPEVRAKVLRLANHYRLFEGVPGVTSMTFEGEKQVTRYEMAKVVHRLMRLGEARGVVDPRVQAPQVYTFSDLPATAWPYNEVKDVSDRYQVMVGFPDATFRGPEELTRYQFAASASQTFPLVVALVEKTQEKKDQDEHARRAAGTRFQEDAPVVLGAGASFAGGVQPGGLLRGVGYLGSVFALGEVAANTLTTTGDRLHAAELSVGYAFPLGTAFHLQPCLGGRAVTAGANTLGGLTYGAIAYWRPSFPFGAHLRAAGTSPLGATVGNPQGAFLGSYTGGLWWHPADRWAFVLEGGWSQWPTTMSAPAATPFTSEGVPQATLGVGYKF